MTVPLWEHAEFWLRIRERYHEFGVIQTVHVMGFTDSGQ